MRIRALATALLFLASCAKPAPSHPSPDPAARAALNSTVAGALSDRRVADAFSRVDRADFVPPELAAYAYADNPLPIGEGQTISQPSLVAMMTDALDVGPAHKVLEIGTGSGYQAAILARLAERVYTVEIVPILSATARVRLMNLGYKNVVVIPGNGYKGLPDVAPFDRILLTAAPAEIPQPLIEQLAEGGKLVAPIGKKSQELILLAKRGGTIEKKSLGAVRFVPMVHPPK